MNVAITCTTRFPVPVFPDNLTVTVFGVITPRFGVFHTNRRSSTDIRTQSTTVDKCVDCDRGKVTFL